MSLPRCCCYLASRPLQSEHKAPLPLTTHASLGAGAVCYSFTVTDFHRLPFAGLPAHSSTHDPIRKSAPPICCDAQGTAAASVCGMVGLVQGHSPCSDGNSSRFSVGVPHRQGRLRRARRTRTSCQGLSSRPEEFHLRALPEPCMTLSSHTAPDVRRLP